MDSQHMDHAQALKLLGLSEGASPAQIEQAHEAKLKQVQGLLEKAPTDGLKDKYRKIQTQLEDAKRILNASESGSNQASSSIQSPRSQSPLSQTKLADLPGANPMQTHLQGQPAGAELQIQAGQTLAGRYKIKELIAAGGMGAVYRAHDTNRNCDIAIKVMLPQLLGSESARDRFLSEARLSSELSHPNIVNVYDVQNEGELYFITMELLEGQDLRAFISSHQNLRQNVEVEEAVEIVGAVCEALEHAHTVTVHRDIKPENIFLCDDGKVKLMDFGIARIMSNTQRTQTGAASGTAYYMAPEQLKGRSQIDGRADQYALGILLYELLSGDVPTGRMESLKQVRKDVPKGLSQAVDKALSPKADERYGDITAFAQAIVKKGGTVGLPSFSLGSIGGEKFSMAAAAIVGILLISGVVQSGVVDFGSMFMSKAEIAQRKASSAQLAGEIKNLQKRLENGRRSLDSDVKEASKKRAKNLKALQQWQTLTDEIVFEGSKLIELEGQVSLADVLLAEGSFDEAELTYQSVRNGYQKISDTFISAEKIYPLQSNIATSRKQWFKDKKSYRVTADAEEKIAVEYESMANSKLREGEILESIPVFEQTLTHWKAVHAVNDSKVRDLKYTRTLTDNGRYSFLNSGAVVKDNMSGLEWMRCSIGQEWKGRNCVGVIRSIKERDIETEVKKYKGWRLPTMSDMRTLIFCSSNSPRSYPNNDFGCAGTFSQPTIYEKAFIGSGNSNYWVLETKYSDGDASRYFFNFTRGNRAMNSYSDQNARGYFRLVRD